MFWPIVAIIRFLYHLRGVYISEWGVLMYTPTQIYRTPLSGIET